MKRILFILVVSAVTFNLSAQSTETTNTSFANAADIALNSAGSNNVRAHGTAFLFVNPKRQTEGSFYLFDTWKNDAIIETKDNKKFRLRNINIDLRRNSFQSRIDNDSIFTFNLNNIEKFIINNKVFKNVYYDGGKRVYQVVYESDDYTILKAYDVKLISGSPNPMVNRMRDKYVRKESFFLKQDNKVKPFRLTKRKIQTLVGDETKINELDAYMKKYKLSYKKELDVQKALKNIL